MKVYSVDPENGEGGRFYAKKGEAKQKSTELRKEKTHHTVRSHEVKSMNSERLAKILNDAADQPWADNVEVIQKYDGTRSRAPTEVPPQPAVGPLAETKEP